MSAGVIMVMVKTVDISNDIARWDVRTKPYESMIQIIREIQSWALMSLAGARSQAPVMIAIATIDEQAGINMSADRKDRNTCIHQSLQCPGVLGDYGDTKHN